MVCSLYLFRICVSISLACFPENPPPFIFLSHPFPFSSDHTENHWKEMRVLILVANDQKKAVGSTEGMQKSLEGVAGL